MTSEALQGALDVSSSSNLSPVALLDVTGRAHDRDTHAARPGDYLATGCAGVKPVRSPEALRLVVDLLGHCERKPDLQARVMEALVDALDGSSAGIQVILCCIFLSRSLPSLGACDGESDVRCCSGRTGAGGLSFDTVRGSSCGRQLLIRRVDGRPTWIQ